MCGKKYGLQSVCMEYMHLRMQYRVQLQSESMRITDNENYAELCQE